VAGKGKKDFEMEQFLKLISFLYRKSCLAKPFLQLSSLFLEKN